MKKYVVFFIFSYFLPSISFSQKNREKEIPTVKVGINVTPKGVISLREPQKGATSLIGISAVVSISYKRVLINTQYSFNSNSFGVLTNLTLNKWVGFYGAGTKSVLKKGGYGGVGVVVTPPTKPFALMIETGTTWDTWSPSVSFGALIPLTIKLGR
jgi:hypothetical protein